MMIKVHKLLFWMSMCNRKWINANSLLLLADKTGFNRTSINRNALKASPESSINDGTAAAVGADQAAFMAAIEEDAKRRAASRKMNRRKAEEWKEKGNAYYKAGEFAEAKRCYEEGVKLIRDWDVLYTNLAMTCNKLVRTRSFFTSCICLITFMSRDSNPVELNRCTRSRCIEKTRLTRNLDYINSNTCIVSSSKYTKWVSCIEVECVTGRQSITWAGREIKCSLFCFLLLSRHGHNERSLYLHDTRW